MNEQDHWLVRASTIRKLSWASAILLGLTVLAQLAIDVKGFFGVDAWFGFGAIFGFAACAAMVGVAKVLGRWLKRDEHYYEAQDD
jgi:hypothetical protein